MSATLYRFEQVDFAYPGGDPVLRDVNWRIGTGATLITGPSGAGKSTLLAMLAAISRPTAGRLWFGDDEIGRWPEALRDRLRGGGVGLVFQHAHLNPEMSVTDNLILALAPIGLGIAAARRRAVELLGHFHLEALAPRAAKTLSGGQAQRVAILRALAPSPKVILLDEPSAHLDDRSIEQLGAMLEQIHAEGVSMVLSSHDPRLTALSIIGQRWHLSGGQLQPGGRS